MSSLYDHLGKPLIAAIIPTYNEERNIAGVIEVLRASEILDEIIIVDDGSVDKTVEIARKFAATDRRMQVIQHEQNKGKGQAIFTGWAATTAPYLLLLDADLHKLTPDHILALMAPVLDNHADMTLGLFWGGHIITDFSSWAMPFLTGQRGLRSEILKHISREAAAGYGFEIALTVAASQQSYHKHIVPLKGVWHPPSEFHRGGLNGIIWRFRMYGQIIRGWVIATRQRHPKVKTLFSTIPKP
ncbi:MAG: glycosyltransferase family 2 protein [Anaerolineales bacterium]|nr:glycosyltransferase family 2 protein [Anaerolineales bacterium]